MDLATRPITSARRRKPESVDWQRRADPSLRRTHHFSHVTEPVTISGGSRHHRGRRAGRRVQQRRNAALHALSTCAPPAYNRNLIAIPTNSNPDSASAETAVTPPPLPIPVRIGDSGAARGGVTHGTEGRAPGVVAQSIGVAEGPRYHRCLTEPRRLTQRQTEQLRADAPQVQRATPPIQRGRFQIELFNVQSFLPKKPDIIEDIQHRNPDILCYTETHLEKSTPLNLTLLPGYHQFREDRTTNRKKSGGGVSIHVKEELQAEKVTVPSSSGSGANVESVWVKVKVDMRKSVIVGCYYRPPSAGEQVHKDFNFIEEQLQHVIASFPSQRIIVNGDLNADSRTN